MERDFYRPPQADDPATDSAVRSDAPLYRTRHIGVAAFLGTPVGGLLLVHLNERRLGRATHAWAALVLAGMSLCGLLAVALYVSEPRMIGIMGVVGTCIYAELTQGTEVRLRHASGARQGSGWRAAGIGAASGAVLFALAVVVGLGFDSLRSRVDFGHDQLVFYEGGASEAEAQKLGELLKSDGFFSDEHGAHVTLAKDGGGYEVSFILAERWDDPAMVTYFEGLRGQISETVVASAPVTVVLLDEWSEPRRTLR